VTSRHGQLDLELSCPVLFISSLIVPLSSQKMALAMPKHVHSFLFRTFALPSTQFPLRVSRSPSLALHRFKSSTAAPPAPPPPPPPEQADKDTSSHASYTQPPHKLSQTVTSVEKHAYKNNLSSHLEKQAKSPWLRAGADHPPVEKIGRKDKLVRGKLLTTPSRLLKLVIPLAQQEEQEEDNGDGRKDLEPLALLVHPSQPLSYLERLVQSELPTLKLEEGSKERVRGVEFRAPEAVGEGEDAGKNESSGHEEGEDVTVIDGKRVKTGVIRSEEDGDGDKKKEAILPDPETQPANSDPETFVRWSGSTEVGDFIRDAARARHFALHIEGYPEPILVDVPSFQDRTYYLRMRLRQKSKEIEGYADIKKECDDIAEHGAKRVAVGVGAGLVSYWGFVFFFTFQTSLGWDFMEPVTYLVGLSTLIAGYAWFLIHNRQVSYRSAMNFTISRRQQVLYDQKGFDVRRWEELIEEGNKLRREIKMVAEEYDVEWNERKDADSDKAIEALEKERKKKKEEKRAEKEEKDD
jgi:hypothetical protein